jgi:flavin-dependent dehydrogenase
MASDSATKMQKALKKEANFYEILPNRTIVYYHYRQERDKLGNVISQASDPIVCTMSLDLGTMTYVYPHGQTEISYGLGSSLKHKVVFRDGAVLEQFRDGKERIKYPDGSVFVQDASLSIKHS